MRFVFMFFFLVFLFGLGFWLLIKFGMLIVCKEEVSVWFGLLIFSIWLVNLLGLIVKLDFCDCFVFFWFVFGVDILLVSLFEVDKDLVCKCLLSERK